MPQNPSVILSAFADEGARYKTALEQMTALAALGLKYYSPRFIDVPGTGKIEHVTELSDENLAKLNAMHAEYGISVTSIGARIGKVKLLDIADTSHNKYVAPADYLAGEVARTIRVAKALNTKLIRGFSFYHPAGEDAWKYVDQAVERLRPIVDECARHGLIFGLEVEPNLVGQNGHLLAALAERVQRDNMVCIFDGGNLTCQNLSPMQVLAEFIAVRDHVGWIHIKDYKVDTSLEWTGVVDEERLKNFVPANIGDTGHEAIFRHLREHLPAMTAKMQKLGVPGFFLELEPHLKGGGQFGGYSGPDGMGVGLRALCSALDYTGIDYELRSMDDIRKARGF